MSIVKKLGCYRCYHSSKEIEKRPTAFQDVNVALGGR